MPCYCGAAPSVPCGAKGCYFERPTPPASRLVVLAERLAHLEEFHGLEGQLRYDLIDVRRELLKLSEGDASAYTPGLVDATAILANVQDNLAELQKLVGIAGSLVHSAI